MKKFWVELPSEICVALEKAAVDAKASGLFQNVKQGGKKAMAELILTTWAKKGCPGSAPQSIDPFKAGPTKPEGTHPKSVKPRSHI